MRIPGNIYSNPSISARADRAAATEQTDAQGKATSAKKPDPGDVTVKVSSQAKVLANDNALDMAKVARLRSAIDNGSFAIGYEAIAAKLIETGG